MAIPFIEFLTNSLTNACAYTEQLTLYSPSNLLTSCFLPLNGDNTFSWCADTQLKYHLNFLLPVDFMWTL